MPEKGLHKFFLGIVLPSILAICLFVVSIFALILPAYENTIMDKKKEMIRELTNTAWSLLEEFNLEHMNLNYSLEEAQQMAASRIEKIRYGGEYKDYFWIIDEHPTMIMHPYTLELVNTDLTDYKDPNGKRLFVEAVNLVAEQGEGYIDYMWQWKDDSSRIVPKLSFVKGYQQWGWIIGTGIYLEDVREEIRALKNRLLKLSLIITLFISIILLFSIRQSHRIENERKDAETRLKLSRQKYKSLVEASTEGTLMILNHKIIFSNLKFSQMAGCDNEHIASLRFEDLFLADWNKIAASFDDPEKSISLETKIRCSDLTEKEVIISVSRIKYADEDGYIIITKEITQQKQTTNETEYLSQELQTMLLLMNQPIRHYVTGFIKCHLNTTIHDAAVLMTRKNQDVILIQGESEFIGIINNSDLKKRVIAENRNIQRPVSEIMTSPVCTIQDNALLFEAILRFSREGISHLGVKNDNGELYALIRYQDVTAIFQNSVSYLVREIETAEDIGQLKKIHNRLPVLIGALIDSGDKTPNITRIITAVSDAITSRIIALAIDTLGNPPCDFAFMVMGSEGRMEQTLSTDQDNAIVFQDLPKDEMKKAYQYFLQLGHVVSQNLNEVGYAYCKGNIMASNPQWTQPLAMWKEYFTGWIETSDPQSILDASIFFDFRYIYGTTGIVDELRTHVNHSLENKSVFFYHLAQSVTKFKPPLSLFGSIIGKNDAEDHVNLDIKKILMPIAGFIRVYALKNKVGKTNSLARVRELYTMQVITKSMHDELILSYNYLMQLRFRFQTLGILESRIPDNIVDINKLTHIEVATLKKVFAEIGNLQTKINFDFKGTL